jgi:hypothetical protein
VLAGPLQVSVSHHLVHRSVFTSPALSHGKECSRGYVIAKGEYSKTKSRLPGRDFVKLATGEAV